MTKEQKEAIDRIKYNDIAKPLYCGDITICNIDDLETILSMLEEKDKIIDLMAEDINGYQIECNRYFKDKEEVKKYFRKKVNRSEQKEVRNDHKRSTKNIR